MPITTGALQQQIEQNDEKHEDAHKRIRLDIRELERRVDDGEREHRKLVEKVTRMESTPTDVMKLQFTSRTVAVIVAGALGLASAQWALNASLRSDVLRAIDGQSKVIESMQRRQELQQFEIQRLSEAIGKLGGSR